MLPLINIYQLIRFHNKKKSKNTYIYVEHISVKDVSKQGLIFIQILIKFFWNLPNRLVTKNSLYKIE